MFKCLVSGASISKDWSDSRYVRHVLSGLNVLWDIPSSLGLKVHPLRWTRCKQRETGRTKTIEMPLSTVNDLENWARCKSLVIETLVDEESENGQKQRGLHYLFEGRIGLKVRHVEHCHRLSRKVWSRPAPMISCRHEKMTFLRATQNSKKAISKTAGHV